MKTNAGRRTLIEVKRIYCFDDVPAEFVPRISLCKDAFRKALGAVAAVGLCTTSNTNSFMRSIIAVSVAPTCQGDSS